MNEPLAIIAASTRRDSINAALARRIGATLSGDGAAVDLIDLADYNMPLYHGDDEAADGPPPAAAELVDRLRAAQSLIIVTPEYNGAFPPLLKNTFDWMSRVDRKAFAHLDVFLASASPGGMGGARGLAMTRMWLENMRVNVADRTLSVPNASLDDDGEFVSAEPIDLREFLPALAH